MANTYTSKVVLANGEILIDLTGDTITAQQLTKGYTAHDKSGAPITGENTFDSDTSNDTADPSEVLIGKTFHARGQGMTGAMPDNGSVAGTISTRDGEYVVNQGFHDGGGKVAIDPTERAKIIPSNIRQGVTVLGIEGEMSGSEGIVVQEKSATPKFTAQTITPDSGYTHLSSVMINPITVTYSDNSAGGKTVTIGAV